MIEEVVRTSLKLDDVRQRMVAAAINSGIPLATVLADVDPTSLGEEQAIRLLWEMMGGPSA